MSKKKGQETAINATYLIVVIALLILAYFLLLPENEKDKFTQPAYPNSQVQPRGYPVGSESRNLLSESPGILYPQVDQGFTKQLASVNLFSTTNSRLMDLASVITPSSSMLSAESKELTFRLDDLKNIASANLLFFAAESKGKLSIKLNGNEIFNDIPSSANIPIPLPLVMLKSSSKIEFTVEKPTLFGSNRYVIRNVQLSLKIKQENKLETRTFILSKTERTSLQGLSLFYVVNCFTVNENGRLLIRLNGRIISDNMVVCDAGEVSLDLGPQDVLEGRNILEFEIDKGRYVLERVLIEGAVGQQRAQNYFFTLQLRDIDLLRSGAGVFLEMEFRKDGLRKVGAAYINGFPLYIDTFDDFIEEDITDFVTDGRNVIRILPQAPFEVVNMNVVLG